MLTAIVAIGNQGQIGLNGELPWHDSSDLKWFRNMTMGKTLIVGTKTAETLPPLTGRNVVIWNRENLSEVLRMDAIIIGGAKTYELFAPHISRWHVGRIDYDGPADAWFDPMWMISSK
jgi:dihydromethanopterin reductase